jgi:hypothetical protein
VADPIRIEGLAEARKQLKKMADVDKTREYKLANARIAQNIVIPAAQARASTRMEQRAASTLVAVKSATGGAVRLGKGFQAAFGAEFGAQRNQARQGRPGGVVATVSGWNQFKAWRGSGGEAGFFLWPGIRDKTDEIVREYGELYEDLFDEGA